MTHLRTPVAVRHIVVTSLGPWAPSWDALVIQAAVPSPFLRSWWLGAVASEKAEFVLCLEGDALIGGLALERRRRVLGVPIYQFIGSGTLSPDHLDILAARGKESIVQRSIERWFTQRGSRVLDLDGVVENSLVEKTFDEASTTVIGVAPWDVLPADPGEYLAALSSNLRKVVRRTQQRLLAAGVTHRRIAYQDATTDAAAAALDDYVRLQEVRSDRVALLREMPRLKRALMAGWGVGEVQIDVLEFPDRVVVVLISFRLGGAIRVYQSARSLDHDLRDAKLAMLVEVVRHACENGLLEVDLLRGDEPYKARFVRRKRDLRRVRVGHGPLGFVVLAGLQIYTRARSVAGRARRSLSTQRGLGRTGRNRARATE